jgi:LacI family transcriptional regulator
MKNDKISVKDIAEMAGTSVATVSRVINQNGRFSKETEQRVKEIIEKYDYQPNQLARGLRVSHTRIVGILVPDITNDFFSSLTREVQLTLMQNGYMTLICNTNEDEEQTRKQVQMLLAQKVSGIIYIGEINSTEKFNIPTVYLDRDPRSREADLELTSDLIECDNIQGGYLAGQELVRKGARKVTFVCFDKQLIMVKKRIQGYCQALEEAGLEVYSGIYAPNVTYEDGAEATRQILERQKDIDGIFYTSDVLAIGGLNYLQSVGIEVPGQIKIVGFDGIKSDQIVNPQLTTVQQSVQRMGELAAQRLLARIRGEDLEPERIRIPVELIERGTT